MAPVLVVRLELPMPEVASMNRVVFYALALTAASFLVGCGGGAGGTIEPTSAVPKVKPIDFKPDVDAGIPVSQPESIDVEETAGRTYRDNLLLLAARFPYMQVPAKAFDLRLGEKAYEAQQEMERFYGSSGQFAVSYTPPEEKVDTTIFEPQPYRRLSGIVVGSAVTALIEMGNGKTELIRPGMKIPDSEWTVISIDDEKAVLRRSGNRAPKQIVVRLESPPPGTSPALGGQGGFGGPGGPPGGPGGPPGGAPGFPGGPGGKGGRGGLGGND